MRKRADGVFLGMQHSDAKRVKVDRSEVFTTDNTSLVKLLYTYKVYYWKNKSRKQGFFLTQRTKLPKGDHVEENTWRSPDQKSPCIPKRTTLYLSVTEWNWKRPQKHAVLHKPYSIRSWQKSDSKPRTFCQVISQTKNSPWLLSHFCFFLSLAL